MSRRFDNRMQYGTPRNTPPLPGYRNMRQGNNLPLHHNQGVPYSAPPVQAPYPPNNAPNPFLNNRPQPFHRGNAPMPPNGGNEQKGGFISKIFRKSKTNNAMSANPFSLPANSSRSAATAAAAGAASSGGLLQSILNPANLTTMLNNTQSVLQAAESITPYVQQYGPMIKNIPAMWKLYRGTQTDDNATTTDPPTTSVVIESPPKVLKKTKPITKQQEVESSIQDLQPVRIKPKIKPRIKPSATVIAESSSVSRKTWRKGESKPKLFI